MLEAFAAGCGGRMASTAARRLEPGQAAFYGVRPAWAALWAQAKAESRDWFYIDNAYFDCCRESYFRVTKNAIQHTGLGPSDGKRFAALGIEIKPMRIGVGTNAVICAQSAEFMEVVAGDPDWLARVSRDLRQSYGEARVLVRTKNEKRPLRMDLQHAGLLVTWSSTAAVTALLEGVQVECSEQCAAFGVTDRKSWAETLADRQWSLDEIARGDAWKALNAE